MTQSRKAGIYGNYKTGLCGIGKKVSQIKRTKESLKDKGIKKPNNER